MTNEQHLLKFIQTKGANFTSPVLVSKIHIDESLRNYCLSNQCGLYNTNWACPPACGEIPDLTKNLMSFEKAIVFQCVHALQDSFDWEGMMQAGVSFSHLTHSIQKGVCSMGLPSLLLGSGGCRFCSECSYPNPCRFPKECILSLEAYGIDVTKLCEEAGLHYTHGIHTVTNIGLLAYQPKNETI